MTTVAKISGGDTSVHLLPGAVEGAAVLRGMSSS